MNPTKFGILYVDDEEKSCHYFTKLFKNKYQVHTAGNAFDGFDILREKHESIAVVMADQRMPGTNGSGVQFLSRCRTHYPNIVRILVTAYSDYDAVITAINACEVYRYIQKPWDVQELETMIGSAVCLFERQKQEKQTGPTTVALTTSGGIEQLPPVLTSLPFKKAKRMLFDSFEALYLQKMLAQSEGNVSAAARISLINRRTIQRFQSKIRAK